MAAGSQEWLYEIKPKAKFIDLNFKEIWRYRDLLWLFVKRDIVTVYKQTILGPLWFLIQPLFTSVIFTLIFNNVAGIDTGSVPPFLFNLSGLVLWTYFKECLNSASSTFKANQGLFGKVYFPRVIVPLSKAVSGLFKFSIQLFILIIFYFYYLYQGSDIAPGFDWFLFFVPILAIASIALGTGFILTALTTKYRDLSILIGFGLNLLMYLSAVMYPLQEAKKKLNEYYWLIEYNPLAQVIEAWRYMLLGGDQPNIIPLLAALGLGVIMMFIGLVIFNRTERNFIDTV
ncbi:ABC transporter permease [Nonlabens xiamenensis]|uniref:ABC transporter permease n=1 Tax=Nonlabens xiamenensis TaxID=2341043 RepID=UPI000F60B7D7|nr:ABC transporter permease [Nonlabens xiamenensis]